MNYILYHDIHPVLFSIMSIDIWYYGILFSLNAIIAYYFIHYMYEIYYPGLKYENFFQYISIFAIIIIFFFARLFHIIFYDLHYYSKNVFEIFYFWKGGISSHGTYFGIMILIFFIKKISKIFSIKLNYLKLADFFFVFILSTSLIRIGNFINAEVVGAITKFPFAISYDYKRYQLPPYLFPYYLNKLKTNSDFKRTILDYHSKTKLNLTEKEMNYYLNTYKLSDVSKIHYILSTAPRHLSQLYEFLGGIFIFILCLYFYCFKNLPNGFIASLAGFLCFIFRFIIEFFKEYQTLDPQSILTMGQFLSLPIIFISLFFLVFLSFKNNKSFSENK